ncbi:SLATT domain-containing protein [Chitinophaga sp. Hz27]|uniref:SLATT domain-containing protein n=1 Tax=Chitinophaga sp. Hz27 TaxID=3347169 RepID=UPI0035E2F50C
MEQSFQANEFEILESQLRENYGKVVYSHKTQEKCADLLTKRNNRIKNFQIILSALITTGLLVRVFKGQEWALLLSTVLSALQFGLTSFLKEYNLGETIQKHATAALELLDVREQYLSLLTDVKARLVTVEDIRNKRDELQGRLSKTYKGSPRTFGKAYSMAQNALQKNDELTFSDDELDRFLPAPLRKNHNQIML